MCVESARERLVSRLELIESHQSFVLIKNCFAIPKLQYVHRVIPAYIQVDNLSRLDRSLVAALAAVSNVSLGGQSLAQAALPVGLGDIALPAFISSLHSISELVEAVLQNVHH